MKSFATVFCLIAAALVVRADDMKLGSAYGGGAAAPAAPAAGGGYGAASIPAPPCPKNYLFSCQPSLQPAPCSQPAGYGGAGAYSENYPVYALQVPQYVHGYQTY